MRSGHGWFINILATCILGSAIPLPGDPPALAAAAPAATPVQHAAAAPKPMSLIDLAQLPRIAGAAPQLSPDGKSVAYLLSRTDWKAGRLIFQIWRQDTGGGAPVQLTFADGGIQPGAL